MLLGLLPQPVSLKGILHYDDVTMTMLASQITSLTVVYSIVYSGVNQRKHQSSASLAFVWEIHRGPVNFPHKWPVTRKMFPFDDVIMTYLGHFTDIYIHTILSMAELRMYHDKHTNQVKQFYTLHGNCAVLICAKFVAIPEHAMLLPSKGFQSNMNCNWKIVNGVANCAEIWLISILATLAISSKVTNWVTKPGAWFHIKMSSY